MSPNNLYVYHHGNDCLAIEKSLMEWMRKDFGDDSTIRVINQRPRSLEPDDEGFLPDWDLGINVDKNHLNEERFLRIISFFIGYAARLKVEFVVGSYNEETGFSEDITFIESRSKLRKVVRKAAPFFVL